MPFIRLVFLGTFLAEGLGAVLLSIRFVPQFGWGRGIYYGVWHSICLAEGGPIGPRVLGDQPRHAGGGGGREQGVQEGRASGSLTGQGQHQQRRPGASPARAWKNGQTAGTASTSPTTTPCAPTSTLGPGLEILVVQVGVDKAEDGFAGQVLKQGLSGGAGTDALAGGAL